MRDIPQLQPQPGISLVLSGGATKAFYFHLGVLNVLGPQHITSIVGSSAGAVLGAFIASGASVDTLITSLHQKKVYVPKFDTWVKSLTSGMLFRPRYAGLGVQSLHTGLAGLRFLASLPRLYNRDLVAELMDRLIQSQAHISGFFDASVLEDLFKGLLPSTSFSDTEIDLYIIGTCLDCPKRGVFNGKYDFEDDGNRFMTDVPIHRAVRASSAVPGMFEPVKINGHYYVDGEIKQTLSADIGVRLANKVIISHTYQPLYMNSESDFTLNEHGWLNIVKQATTMVFHERINVWKTLYQQQNPDKEILWIQPESDDVDFFMAPEFSFRPEIQEKMIKSGERAARRILNKPDTRKSDEELSIEGGD